MANYYDLMKSMKLGDDSTEVLTLYDYVVFMGDMNFRVDYPFDKAVELIEAK